MHSSPCWPLDQTCHGVCCCVHIIQSMCQHTFISQLCLLVGPELGGGVGEDCEDGLSGLQ